MVEQATGVLDETGEPIGGTPESKPRLVDEGGRPIAHRHDGGLGEDVGTMLRSYPVASLLAGILIGYALGAGRRTQSQRRGW